jgi:acetyl/propionyl-CoA carboxylase alpha subunit
VTFDVEAASRTLSVQVLRSAGGYDVTIDGRRRMVDAVPIGRRAWSLLFGGRSYDVGIVERTGSELIVYVNGRMVPVRLGGRLRGRRRATTAADPGRGPSGVVAPMPGRVVKVLVKAGDKVAARQGLVVVEAMKMENELRAPRAGVVREVRVAEGASVEAHTVLVVIE